MNEQTETACLTGERILDWSDLPTVVAIVAGLVGSLTGLTALGITIWQLRKRRPRLNIYAFQADHWIDNSWLRNFPDSHPHTRFNVRLRVSNMGKEPTEISDPTYEVESEDKRWSLAAGMVVEEERGKSPDESPIKESVQVPGRAVRRVYIGFSAPRAIRKNVGTRLLLTDGDGREIVLPMTSLFLNYENPEIPTREQHG